MQSINLKSFCRIKLQKFKCTLVFIVKLFLIKGWKLGHQKKIFNLENFGNFMKNRFFKTILKETKGW